jgi:hypothetical protein
MERLIPILDPYLEAERETHKYMHENLNDAKHEKHCVIIA